VREGKRLADALWLAVILTVGNGCAQAIPRGDSKDLPVFATFQASGGGRLACCAMVDLDSSGQLLLGRVDHPDGRSRAWLAQIGATGHVRWDGEFPLQGRQSALAAGVATSDGSVYVVGRAVEGSSGTDRQGSRLLLAKTRLDGVPQWIRTLSFGLDTSAEGVIASRSGALVVTGIVRNADGRRSVFLASFSRLGDLLWQRPIIQASDSPDIHIRELEKGGYLVSGSFGLVYLEADGRQRWVHQGVEVVVGVEEIGGDLYVIGALPGARARGFELRRLSADGAVRSKREVLKDLCWVAGAWTSARLSLIVAGNLCDSDGELEVLELSDREDRSMARIALATGASAYRAQRSRDGHLIAAGMFDQGSTNALRGWFFKSQRRLLDFD